MGKSIRCPTILMKKHLWLPIYCYYLCSYRFFLQTCHWCKPLIAVKCCEGTSRSVSSQTIETKPGIIIPPTRQLTCHGRNWYPLIRGIMGWIETSSSYMCWHRHKSMNRFRSHCCYFFIDGQTHALQLLLYRYQFIRDVTDFAAFPACGDWKNRLSFYVV